MTHLDPFVAQNTIMAFLAISAFAFAGAEFFKDTILKNVLDVSKSFAKDDLVRQNEIFNDIASPGFYDASEFDITEDIENEIKLLRKRLRKLTRQYKKNVKKELEYIFGNCRLYTFSFGVFALGYIFLISLFLQGALKNHFIIYLYTFMYLFFIILLYIYEKLTEKRLSSVVARLLVYCKNSSLRDAKDKVRIDNAYRAHYTIMVKYIFHFVLVLFLLMAAYYIGNNHMGVKKEAISILVYMDVDRYCSPITSFVLILLYYLIRTLIVPFYALDRKSTALLLNYSNKRNTKWSKHKVIIENKIKRDNIIKDIETMKLLLNAFFKKK